MPTKTSLEEEYRGYKIHKVRSYLTTDQGDIEDFCRYEVSGGKLMQDEQFETFEMARAGIDKIEE